MTQMHIFLQNKTFHKNNLFSYVTKQKKMITALMLTPLLAACNESLFFPAVPIPTIAELEADGYTVHTSPTFFDDTFLGGAADDAIIGLTGNDTYNGGAGDDLIFGQDGDDVLLGGNDNDSLYGGSGKDELYGGNGDDLLAPGSDYDSDYINGGTGNDTISYLQHSGTLSIDLSTGFAYTNAEHEDTFIGIENVEGALNHENTIFGNAFDNILKGGNQNDHIEGGGGNDVIEGLEGDDVLYGDSGDDELIGGDGDDILIGGDDDDILIGGRGSDTLVGGLNSDIFVFSNFDIDNTQTIDTITNYGFLNDRIDFSALNYINNFADVGDSMDQIGDNVEITLDAQGDHILVITDWEVGFFVEGHFIFA